MRNTVSWLAFTLIATLVLGEQGLAQPPGRRGPPPGGPGNALGRALDDLKLSADKREKADGAVRTYQENIGRLTDLASADLLLKMKGILSPDDFKKFKEVTDAPLPGPGRGPGRRPSVDDMVDRILAFDKNGDGKVTKDELPERMQDLIAKGDKNKDGALDKDEIKALAADLARSGSFLGRGRGGRAPGGRGIPGGPGIGLPPPVIERAVDDLKLSEDKKESATAAAKAYQDNVRQLTSLARADLLLRMNDLMTEEQLKNFKVVLDRQPGPGDRPFGPAPGRGRRPGP